MNTSILLVTYKFNKSIRQLQPGKAQFDFKFV